jgi:hypothetical protein
MEKRKPDGLSKTVGDVPRDSECLMYIVIAPFHSIRSRLSTRGVKFRCLPSGVKPPHMTGAPRTDMHYGVETFI